MQKAEKTMADNTPLQAPCNRIARLLRLAIRLRSMRRIDWLTKRGKEK